MYIFKIIIVVVVCVFATNHAFAQSDVITTQLKSENAARINSPMSGRILKVNFKDGESFEKGEALIEFECAEKKAILSQMQARVDRQSKLLEATRRLFDLGSSSETDVAVLKAEYREAVSAKDVASEQVKKCKVLSPFSGQVAALFVRNHYSIQEAEPLIELVGGGQMHAEMIVPSKWMRSLKPGSKFQIEIDETGLSYEASILRFGGRVDPVTQSVRLYASIDQETPELLTGMSGVAVFKDVSLNQVHPDAELKNHNHAKDDEKEHSERKVQR